MLQIKRTYEPPARGDGRRILVERLWPRGMKKESLEADAWMKEVAPSTELRKWFDHRVERWEKFQQRYRDELDAKSDAWEPILDAVRRGTVTLLYSADDTVHNGAVVLREYLVERAAESLLATFKGKLDRPANDKREGRQRWQKRTDVSGGHSANRRAAKPTGARAGRSLPSLQQERVR